MRHSFNKTFNLAKYVVKKKLSGDKHFPLVMMLEPLHACNLTCTGCGRIREYESTIREVIPVDECLKAVDDCGAPIVSICGGEPLIYKDIGPLVEGLLARGKYIYLCTNGMFIRKRLGDFKPDHRFFFNVHLDGMKRSHDLAVEKDGVFDAAIDGIRAAKEAGFQVTSNTTVYTETDMNEIEALYEFLEPLGVDGHTLSPGYSYSAVQTKEIFLDRAMIREKFKEIKKLAKRFPLSDTPVYQEFLAGDRELRCTAWGMPTFNTKGWKGPCYLITDGHYDTFGEFAAKTQWDKYGPGRDPRCENCLVHSGYETNAATGTDARFGDTWKMLVWNLFG
ncbi:MAG: adenosyl-hopene transferase HpnH [Terriglobales bacterium]|jgi:hopanoid biosynthesis associated radical SAM protein HpnH